MIFPSRFLAQVAVSFVLVLRANAESHVIKFINNCGYGYPALVYGGNNILNGADSYTSQGPWAGIAYLQTGQCAANGEQCTLLETNLVNANPAIPGSGSSTDISLISPHVYNVETSFAYYSGCDGQGRICSDPDCTNAAFFSPNDWFVQVACQVDNVNLLIAFCADATQLVTGNGTTTTPGSSSPAISSLPTPSSVPSLGSSTPGSSPLPTPSSVPSSGSSIPGSVPPVTPSTSPAPSATPTPTPTPTQTSTDVGDLGCGETGSTPIPTTTPSKPATSAPTSTPTLIPSNSARPPVSVSASASASPTTSQACRPRPTSLTPSNSAPTKTPVTSASASTSTPSAGRRRHRRTGHILY